MKYVVIQQDMSGKLVKLTRPSTATQARNSLERFKGIGITGIKILPANKAKKTIEEYNDREKETEVPCNA